MGKIVNKSSIVEVYMKQEYKDVHPSLFEDNQDGLYRVLSNVKNVIESECTNDYLIECINPTISLRFNRDKFYLKEISKEYLELQKVLSSIDESIQIIVNTITERVSNHIMDDDFEHKMSEDILELTRLKHEKNTVKHILDHYM